MGGLPVAVLDVEQLIYDVYRAGMKARFEQDPANFAGGYHLSDDERKAVLRGDYPALYAMGVHPMMCMYLARANGLTVPEYLMRISTPGAAAGSRSKQKDGGHD